MGRYVVNRLLAAIPTLLLAAILVFSIVHLIPGDPAELLLGDTATPQAITALREEMGLNRPIIVQFGYWLSDAVRFDLGESIFFRQPVVDVIIDGAETSILLALMTLTWIVCLGIPIGVAAAAHNGTWIDQTLSGAAMLGASIPTFWLGLYLILIFAVGLGWLPSSGYPSIFEAGGLSNLKHLLLPSLALAAPNAALIIRLTRSSMVDILHEDHVRTARAKGLHPVAVLYHHVLRNALIGIISALGITFATLISEAVVTETVFALPGIGRLVVQSVLRRDYPVIQGVILTIVVVYILINLAVDILSAVLDPRIRLQ